MHRWLSFILFALVAGCARYEPKPLPPGPFSNARMVREFSELAPDALENKIYALGVGLISIEEDLDKRGNAGFTVELVSFTIP